MACDSGQSMNVQSWFMKIPNAVRRRLENPDTENCEPCRLPTLYLTMSPRISLRFLPLLFIQNVRGHIGDRVADAVSLPFRKAFREEQRLGGNGELLDRLPVV